MPRYFQHGGAAGSRGFGCFQMVSGPGFRACLPAGRKAWSPPPPERFHRCCRGAAGRPSGLSGKLARRAAFCPFARRFPVRRGAPEAPGGVIFRRAAKNGPVQEKCEGVSSYGLWGLRARLCAMNVRSERMLASARFSATAQLGRVCKKSVRPPGTGVQGGSLSKKLRLN